MYNQKKNNKKKVNFSIFRIKHIFFYLKIRKTVMTTKTCQLCSESPFITCISCDDTFCLNHIEDCDQKICVYKMCTNCYETDRIICEICDDTICGIYCKSYPFSTSCTSCDRFTCPNCNKTCKGCNKQFCTDCIHQDQLCGNYFCDECCRPCSHCEATLCNASSCSVRCEYNYYNKHGKKKKCVNIMHIKCKKTCAYCHIFLCHKHSHLVDSDVISICNRDECNKRTSFKKKLIQ